MGEQMTISQTAHPGKSITSLLRAPLAETGPPARLSESPLWETQRSFYAREAAELWGTATVPHGITSNPRIANTYARLALSFLQAARATTGAPAGAAQVPHIIELGGGTGRFAYLFVRSLREPVRFLHALGQSHMPIRWWLMFWPCVLLGLTLMSLNFLGDALRAKMDPRK